MKVATSSLSRRALLGAGGALLAGAALPAVDTQPESRAADITSLRTASVSLLADALHKIGVDAAKLVMSAHIKPLIDIKATMIGPAVTTKWAAGQGAASGEDIRQYLFRPLDAAAAGSVWVVESGTTELLSMFGDIIGLSCKRKGMAGAVTDSGCRDIAGMAALDFPVFARAPVPFGPRDQIRPIAANVPVTCGGVIVHPGDLIAADADGVLVIPSDSVARLSAAVSKVSEKEMRMRRQIEAGTPLTTAYQL
jgi:4-hydroxy-4-methyl-2-oxoglutarate aldolase